MQFKREIEISGFPPILHDNKFIADLKKQCSFEFFFLQINVYYYYIMDVHYTFILL